MVGSGWKGWCNWEKDGSGMEWVEVWGWVGSVGVGHLVCRFTVLIMHC